jgi:hypothetical protein
MELCKYGWILRDKKRRLTYKKSELRKLVLKTLLYSTDIILILRFILLRNFILFLKILLLVFIEHMVCLVI